jgi:cytosine/adenosine deaminase-related metal-dependent hydrolase
MGSYLFSVWRAAFSRLREAGPPARPAWPLRPLAGSARLAGRVFGEPLLGQLVPGAPADLVVLDYDPPAPLDAASFLGHRVFGLASRHLRDVMVAGEWAVLDRRLARVDQGELLAAARVEAARLWARLEDVAPHPFEPKGDPHGPRRAVPAGQASDS